MDTGGMLRPLRGLAGEHLTHCCPLIFTSTLNVTPAARPHPYSFTITLLERWSYLSLSKVCFFLVFVEFFVHIFRYETGKCVRFLNAHYNALEQNWTSSVTFLLTFNTFNVVKKDYFEGNLYPPHSIWLFPSLSSSILSPFFFKFCVVSDQKAKRGGRKEKLDWA